MAERPPIRRYGREVPRNRREFVAGGTYHLFSRGSNRQRIFRSASDRVDFLECLQRVVFRFGLQCIAYCLMPNHFHLVVETPDERLSDAMKALNGRYSLRYNKRYGADAHLFKNRFGAVHQETDAQLLWTLRYVVNNPVEAGLCAHPSDWRWSSFRASVGDVEPLAFLALDRLLSYFGDTRESAMARYSALIWQEQVAIGV